MTVDEDEPGCLKLPKGKLCDRLRRHAITRSFKNRLKWEFDDWRNVGEPPILVLEGGKPELGKARHTSLAQRKEPGRLMAVLLKPLKFVLVWLGLVHSGFFFGRNHSCTVVWIRLFVNQSPPVCQFRALSASARLPWQARLRTNS